jgi:hypothetical protein
MFLNSLLVLFTPISSIVAIYIEEERELKSYFSLPIPSLWVCLD